MPAARRALAVLNVDDFFEQPHRRLMRQAVDQRHRGLVYFAPMRLPCSACTRLPVTILTRFAEIRRRDPARPIASHAWPSRRLVGRPTSGTRIVAMPIGWRRSALGPGQLVVLGRRQLARRASPSCWRAARLDVPIMPVDAGTTLPEILALADRFAAAAMLVPAALDRGCRALQAKPAVELDRRAAC